VIGYSEAKSHGTAAPNCQQKACRNCLSIRKYTKLPVNKEDLRRSSRPDFESFPNLSGLNDLRLKPMELVREPTFIAIKARPLAVLADWASAATILAERNLQAHGPPTYDHIYRSDHRTTFQICRACCG